MIRIAAALLLMLSALPARAQTFVSYACADGSTISAAFFKGDRNMRMQLDGKALSLPSAAKAIASTISPGRLRQKSRRSCRLRSRMPPCSRGRKVKISGLPASGLRDLNDVNRYCKESTVK